MSASNDKNYDSTQSTNSYELSVKTEVSTETAWIYTFVPGTHENQFICIYPIIPNCGYSFMKKAFTFDIKTSTCFSFTHSKEPTNGLTKLVGEEKCVRGSNLLVIAPKTKSPTNWLQFVLFLKPGNVPISYQDEGSRINTMTLKPVSLICLLSSAAGSQTLILKFKPGVTDRYHEEVLDSVSNEQHVVYFSYIDSSDAKWHPGLDQFLEFKAGGKLPTIKIQESEVIPDIGISNVYSLPHYKRLLSVYTLISNTGEKHICHKFVLKDRSPYFASKFKDAVVVKEMKLKEGPRAVELALQHFYYPQIPLTPSPSFTEAFEVLKLAHVFEMTDLTAIAVNCLITEMESAATSALWKLYSFIQTLAYKMQIYTVLWESLLDKMQMLILEKENDNVDFSEDSYILHMNTFIEFGTSGVPLLEELCNDFIITRKGDSKEDLIKHLESQDIVTKFLLKVIKYCDTNRK